MSDLEITMLIQKFANEDDLYSKEVKNLLSEGGIKRLIGQYKNISRRLDNISEENRELRKRIAELEDKIGDRDEINRCLREQITELESKKVEKSSKIDTSTPIDCANSLISHLTHLEAFLIAPERYERTFDIDDLEQIAEHLLVYCRHNKASE